MEKRTEFVEAGYTFDKMRKAYLWSTADKAIAVAELHCFLLLWVIVMCYGVLYIDFSFLIDFNSVSGKPKEFLPWTLGFAQIAFASFLIVRVFAAFAKHYQKFEHHMLILSLMGVALCWPFFYSTIGIFDGFTWCSFLILSAIGFNILPPIYIIPAQVTTLALMLAITFGHEFLPYDVKAYFLFNDTYVKELSTVDLLYIWTVLLTLTAMSMATLGLLSGSWQEREETLRSISYIDELTEVKNRRSILEGFKMEFEMARENDHELSVAMLDIDHFKRINDNYGHQFGDKALKFIADEIQSICRKHDLVGRYGGEEFLLVFPECTEDQASKALTRLKDRLSQKPLQTENDEDVYLSFSAGVAQLGLTDLEHKDLIAKADAAMYQGKSNGRNQIVIYNV